MTSGDVTIRRLTLHVPDRRDSSRDRGGAASAARSRIERLLNQIDWQPSGYRAGQVWVIRRLINLPPLDARHDREWIAAVERALDDLFRRAVRVKAGTAPGNMANADSLLFEDRADWLALLTLEVVGGQVWTRWYWQSTLSELPARYPGALLASAWSRFPEHLPAALDMLPAAQIERAVALFAPAEVNRVVGTLHERYALPADIFSVTIPDAPDGAAVEIARPAAPWERWTPPLPTAITPQARYLYGLIFTLSRAPGYARSAAFARSASTWLERALAREHLAPHIPVAADRPRRLEVRPGIVDERTDSVSPSVDSQTREMSLVPPVRDDFTLPPSRIQAGEQMESEFATDLLSECSTDPLADLKTTAAHTGHERHTALGGVLFLIHALAWLDLPGLHGEYVGGWAWLDVFARALLGAVPDDPIWDALRKLDRREERALIGAGWAPGEFRLSRRTVQRYLAGGWRAGLHDRRLLLARGGVLVLDTSVPDSSDDHTIAAAICEYTEEDSPDWEEGDLPAPFVVPPSLRMVAGDGLIGWMARVMPCLIHLLRRGLGDPALSIHEIARRVLEQSGYLEITRTHVDLFLPLDSADIALRRAGLDRNPGWLPDYGRIVQFHYT